MIAGTGPLLDVTGNAPFDLRDLLGSIGLGVVTGVMIRLYAWALRSVKDVQSRRSPWITVPAGGIRSPCWRSRPWPPRASRSG